MTKAPRTAYQMLAISWEHGRGGAARQHVAQLVAFLALTAILATGPSYQCTWVQLQVKRVLVND